MGRTDHSVKTTTVFNWSDFQDPGQDDAGGQEPAKGVGPYLSVQLLERGDGVCDLRKVS